jgi:hypothetical protein
MKQTAVEWLINELDLDNNPFNMKRINQAKEMEKEQIIDGITFFKDRPYEVITAKQYYNKTFKSE